MDVYEQVRKCVANYRAGAWCESIMLEILFEIAERLPPDEFLRSLPDDVRALVESAVRSPTYNAETGETLKEVVEGAGFRSLSGWLSQRDAQRIE